MFVDKVSINLQAGDGGNGAISFRHEKFVDHGGPDGGDGGDGGSVTLVASRNQDSLAAFRYKKSIKAESGQGGMKTRKHGKKGIDLRIDVPVGTVASDSAEMICDLTEDGQEFVIAEGGKGGFGNAHFVSSRRQAPRLAEKGEKGDMVELTLELKMIADVGLIGLPNAGKSTLLSVISNATPEIADYPFTTLNPNLGMVDIDKKNSLLFADIPGLIEGASEGKGLGVEFLKHVERTSVLIHLIDATGDVASAYGVIQKELKSYIVDLSKRPVVVVLNKIDAVTEEDKEQKMSQLRAVVPKRTKLMAVSAVAGKNMKELLYVVQELAKKQIKKVEKTKKDAIPILRLPDSDDNWQVIRDGKKFVVTGKRIERFAQRTDFDNSHAVERLRDIIRKMGIAHELIRKGIELENTVCIGENKFKW